MSLFFLSSCGTDTKGVKDAAAGAASTATEVASKATDAAKGAASTAAAAAKETMAAKVQTISLEQTPGEFNQKSLSLKEGTYVFDIANKNVDHEVGFVLAPKGKTDQANHIKAAYVTAPVKTGSSSKTNEVTLTKGEYVYFCPLNPTEQYPLVVK